jgi:hypothetical protein
MKTNITLKTLEQATAQEVFDQVAEHMLTQNEQSKYADGCAYRGDNGLKCAAGCLIGDDEYNNELMEGFTWADMLDRLDAGISTKHNKLISKLQNIHDGIECDLWLGRLLGVANEFGLSDKVITEYERKMLCLSK